MRGTRQKKLLLLTRDMFVPTAPPVTTATEVLTAQDVAVGTQTLEDVQDELFDVEHELAHWLGLVLDPGNYDPAAAHSRLLKLDRAGKLVETELVATWRQLYSSYLSMLRSQENAAAQDRTQVAETTRQAVLAAVEAEFNKDEDGNPLPPPRNREERRMRDASLRSAARQWDREHGIKKRERRYT